MTAAVGFVGWGIYLAWQDGPGEAPVAAQAKSAVPATKKVTVAVPKTPINTDVIISRNLFDPERGAGASREAEEGSRAFQRIRSMILVGTVIIGANRTAILQEGSGANVGAPGQAPSSTIPLRLKLGDNVEGYRLAEIEDKRVVFTKDAARLELALDYFRKVEIAQPRPTPQGRVVPPALRPPVPRVIPNLPRRGRIPVPGNVTPDS